MQRLREAAHRLRLRHFVSEPRRGTPFDIATFLASLPSFPLCMTSPRRDH